MKLQPQIIERTSGFDPSAEGFINKVEISRRLKIKLRTVDNWMRRGMLPYYKVGHLVLFRWSEVQKHLGQTCRVLAGGHCAAAFTSSATALEENTTKEKQHDCN